VTGIYALHRLRELGLDVTVLEAGGELWYAAKTNEWLAEWRELNEELGVWMTGEPTGVRAGDVEMVADIEDVGLDAKRAVLAEHAGQTTGPAAAFGEGRYRRWICQETFRRPNDSDLMAHADMERVRVGSVAS